MNLNLYGHNEQWLMVDCGVTFENPPENTDPESESRPHAHIQMADPDFIVKRREQLAGLIITHAHEDHIGAVPYLWKQLRCPIYTTRFTAEILRRKLREVQLEDKVPVHIVSAGEHRQIGVFDVEWITLTHSIPDPYALLISTDVGRVFHTADWKLDPKPIIGRSFDKQRYRQMSSENINAMICDSTNATVPGHSQSEESLYAGLKQIIANAPARVVVTCFGSNIARLNTLARVAEQTERHLGFVGRSMINMVSAAKATGLWLGEETIVDRAHLGYLPAHTVLLIVTGSQGESRTALHRLSVNAFNDMQLEPEDTVIFSSKMIPGNEEAIEALIKRLEALKITVITDQTAPLPIHVSGHPAEEELKQMYQWVQPEMAIPVHGEAKHMAANAKIAKQMGVPRQLTGNNGDLFFIAPVKGMRRKAVKTGRLGLIDGKLQRL